MQNLSQCRVLIVGDAMLDRYLRGGTSRISPEAPVPIVHVKEDETLAGGAANVALNIASLGGSAELLGIVGQDEAADKLQESLSKAGIEYSFQSSENIPTIMKSRVMSNHQQMLRIDFEQPLDLIDKTDLQNRYLKALENTDVVVLSDYGKGTLSDPQFFIQAAKKKGIPVLVDPKGTDFDKYKDASYITPNFKEFTGVVGECADEKCILSRGLELAKRLNLEGLLVTRGAEGMTLIRQGAEPLHHPTRAREVFDVTGAGDTVIAVFAMGIASKQDLDTTMHLANTAAGVTVSKLGAATVTLMELQRELHKNTPIQTGVINEEDAARAIETSHLMGEKVVFTNGCFDILHVGHVSYLREAQAQGDRLIIAVNSDASVKALKGDSRPIVPLEERMEMLASLDCVDWVVPFDDDTPKRLLTLLQPDVLVKGGDYDREEIVGYEIVEGYGGEVKPLCLKPGRSTTNIIEAIKG